MGLLAKVSFCKVGPGHPVTLRRLTPTLSYSGCCGWKVTLKLVSVLGSFRHFPCFVVQLQICVSTPFFFCPSLHFNLLVLCHIYLFFHQDYIYPVSGNLKCVCCLLVENSVFLGASGASIKSCFLAGCSDMDL